MARKKGKGWHGDRRGHSLAAKKGWRNRKRRPRRKSKVGYVKGLPGPVIDTVAMVRRPRKGYKYGVHYSDKEIWPVQVRTRKHDQSVYESAKKEGYTGDYRSMVDNRAAAKAALDRFVGRNFGNEELRIPEEVGPFMEKMPGRQPKRMASIPEEFLEEEEPLVGFSVGNVRRDLLREKMAYALKPLRHKYKPLYDDVFEKINDDELKFEEDVMDYIDKELER